MEPSEWHSIRPWTRRLSLSIREITSVSATFILSSPLTKAESELPLVSLSVPADDGLDEDDESSDQNIQAVISDALAKGLSVNVNGSPWPRVLIRLDDKQDEAVIIIYGLMPGRQYDIDLGLVHDGNIRRHVITERELPTNSGHILMSYRSATGSTSPHSETDLDVDIAGSNSHSPTTPSNHALSTTPPITTTPSDTNGATITVEDRLKQLQQNLSLLNSDRDSLTATLKSARRDAQKADAALRTEIDILKRASDKHSAAEHRARQKVLALQEAVKRAQSATKEMEALVNEAEAALPVLIAGRGEREHAYDIVRGEADRAKEEMDREAESDMKRIEGLKGELTGLGSKLERLNGKKDKLEGGVIPDLEEQLRAIEKEIRLVEAVPFTHRIPFDADDPTLDNLEAIGSSLAGDNLSDQILASTTHHPSFYHPVHRQHHHSQHLPGAISRPTPAPIQRPTSLNQPSWTIARASHNPRSSLTTPPHNVSRRQLLVKPSSQSPTPHASPSSNPSSPVLSSTQTSTLSSRAPAFEPSLSFTQALRAAPAAQPSSPATSYSLTQIPVHRPRPSVSSVSRAMTKENTKWSTASGQGMPNPLAQHYLT